ncbi:hypothetical protein Cob_v000880 [Colletotrichum orbiculare MAFF 240422]|uniref:Secreted protein n=1 Tax=Colletotrichum orbiculare (strain 104-T / ATCC 96160 / CBS 514.97 / LARS 414 / MAFF 240422) TaxID=1213857 RepID=A0A484G7N3_COLOR|nr:hypothetical protein Cob_v000880 [Colletotrichum orbiculare MAFF 240422]
MTFRPVLLVWFDLTSPLPLPLFPSSAYLPTLPLKSLRLAPSVDILFFDDYTAKSLLQLIPIFTPQPAGLPSGLSLSRPTRAVCSPLISWADPDSKC